MTQTCTDGASRPIQRSTPAAAPRRAPSAEKPSERPESRSHRNHSPARRHTSAREARARETAAEAGRATLDGLGIVSQSPQMAIMFQQVRPASAGDSPVLILGEPGTGKEWLAESIHRGGARRDEPFVVVDTAAVPQSQIEGELFGHVPGAWPGVATERAGRIEAADGGTLYIDDVAELPPTAQVKLLRICEGRSVTRLGGNREMHFEVRVIAATRHDLAAHVAEGQFRRDLFDRLSVLPIRVPPLRERHGDIPLLAERFLSEACRQAGWEHARLLPQIDPALMRFLERFPWPGNVRQLRSCIEHMALTSRRDVLTVDDVPAHLRTEPCPLQDRIRIPLGTRLDELERVAIRQALEHCSGHRRQTAELLGISVRTLQRRLKSFALLARTT